MASDENDAERMGDEALETIQERARQLIELLDSSGFPRDPVSAAALLYVGLFGLKRAGFTRAKAVTGVLSFAANVYDQDGNEPASRGGIQES